MSLVRAVLLLAAAVAGCGTTQITTSDPGARIFVDGEYVGRGRGEVTRRGPPGRATVLVRTDGGERAQATMRRSFGVTTFLLGLVSYLVCWVACWEYPESLYVSLPQHHPGPSWGGGVDPWLQPPAGWTPPAASAAPADAGAPAAPPAGTPAAGEAPGTPAPD